MALVESQSIPLKSPLPAFELKDPTGEIFISHQQHKTKGLVVVFTCNHCPYAIAVWPRIIKLAHLFMPQGIDFVAINPNINPDYPQDSPINMIKKIKEWKIPFPYLVDADQSVAKSFNALCTPDIYVYDADNLLYYHGRVDDNWQDSKKVKSNDLEHALNLLSTKKPSPTSQIPSMGCSIKWNN